MKTYVSYVAITIFFSLFSQSSYCFAGEQPHPVSVFAKLDGQWKGVFVGYDVKGKELYRIQVEQTYRTVDATTQKVEVKDTLPSGEVIKGVGENRAILKKNGTVQLKCIVTKSNGERVVHDGRVIKGADGDEQLVWYSQSPDRSETFREVVRQEGKDTLYTIDGMGHYNGTLILMHGRYKKVR